MVPPDHLSRFNILANYPIPYPVVMAMQSCESSGIVWTLWYPLIFERKHLKVFVCIK